MENLPGKFEKAVKTCRLPEQAKRPTHWTLLLVEDCGRTIQIRWFKTILISWLFLSLFSAATAAFYYYRYTAIVPENQEMPGHPEANMPAEHMATEERTTATAPEKDTAVPVSPVLTDEKRTGGDSREEKEDISENTVHPPSPPIPAAEEKKTAETLPEPIRTDTPADTEKNSVVPKSSPAAENARISVDDFVFSFSKRSKELDIRFNIRNADPDAGPVSGEIFLLLQGRKSSRKKILLPEGKMVSGKPSDDAKGEGFSISRFKSVDMKAKKVGSGNAFNIARVLVYDDDRHLLLQKDMEIVME